LNSQDKSFSESEFQAYVDGQLLEPRLSQMEAFLANNPQEAARLDSYSQQNSTLHAFYDDVLQEPIPERFLMKNKKDKFPIFARSAAAVFFMAMGGLLSFFLQSEYFHKPSVFTSQLIQPAVNAYKVYAPEVLHAVEVKADQQQHLFKWLSKRLETDIKAPDLEGSGYSLIGGRLLPSRYKPSALFMYENKKANRVSLYIRHHQWDQESVLFKYVRKDDVSMFYWIDGEIGYALSGDIDKAELLSLSHVIHESLTR